MRKKLKCCYDRCYKGEGLLRAAEVGLAVADMVAGGGDGDPDGAVGVGGAARGGIVGQEILGGARGRCDRRWRPAPGARRDRTWRRPWCRSWFPERVHRRCCARFRFSPGG